MDAAADVCYARALHLCRLLGVSVVVLAVLYWLSRRSARSQRLDRRAGADAPHDSTASVTLSPGFHRIPVLQKVSLMGNDTIFDSAELYAIDASAKSAAAASAPPALRLLPSGIVVHTCVAPVGGVEIQGTRRNYGDMC
jgi:hypothetical protein